MQRIVLINGKHCPAFLFHSVHMYKKVKDYNVMGDTGYTTFVLSVYFPGRFNLPLPIHVDPQLQPLLTVLNTMYWCHLLAEGRPHSVKIPLVMYLTFVHRLGIQR